MQGYYPNQNMYGADPNQTMYTPATPQPQAFQSAASQIVIPEAAVMQNPSAPTFSPADVNDQEQKKPGEFEMDAMPAKETVVEAETPSVPGSNEGDDYDWKWLCMPRLPWSPPGRVPPYFTIDSKLPIPVALAMGFQHALAMMGGIITPPILVSGSNNARFSTAEIQYLIAAGLICSGLLSFNQIHQIKLWNGYVLGTGMISVVGSSFTFLPIAQAGIAYQMTQDSTRSCQTDADCPIAWAGQSGAFAGQSVPGFSNPGQCNTKTSRCKFSGQEAYGAFLGTAMVCSFGLMSLSFLPRRQLRRLLPPAVTGVCVMLIGIGLLSTSFTKWGGKSSLLWLRSHETQYRFDPGGTFCATHSAKRAVTVKGPTLPGNVVDKYPSKSPCLNGACVPFTGVLSGICSYTKPSYDATNNVTIGDTTVCETFADLPGVFPATPDPSKSFVMCSGNGDIVLPFGSAPYVGLGISVFVMLILIEIFGSPFMRNCQVMIALLFGYILSAAIPYEINGKMGHYVNGNAINSAPWVTFMWVHAFPLSFAPASIVPLLICYLVCSIECVGDITASAEASRLPSIGAEFDARVQGGLLVDGLNSCMAALATVMPTTTYAQNNGVISLTRCASRRAGYACCFWLILLGIIAKFSAIITSIPDSVLGGMTSFLFCNVVMSGVRIVSKEHPPTRRSRFIVVSSLMLGIGVALAPGWATNNLWLWKNPEDQAGQLFHDSIIIVLSTPFCIGTIVALILNGVLPTEQPDPAESVRPGETIPAAAAAEEEDSSARPALKEVQEPTLKDRDIELAVPTIAQA